MATTPETKKPAPKMTKLMGAKPDAAVTAKPEGKEKVTAIKPKAAKKETVIKESAVDVLNTIDQVDSTEGVALVEQTEAEAGDLIKLESEEMANLKEEKAFKLVSSLISDIDHNSFKLGGVLAKISAEGWYMDRGYENFSAYVAAETHIGYRKAMYLIGIYNGLVGSGVSWHTVAHLGWTKLIDLAPHLTPDNVEQWLLEVDGLTVSQIQALIKSKTAADKKIGDTVTAAPKTISKAFKLHEDQYETVNEALAKAKHESGTEIDSVALEFICLDFLSGSKKAGPVKSFKELMAGKTAEEVLEIFGAVFPDIELEASIPE